MLQVPAWSDYDQGRPTVPHLAERSLGAASLLGVLLLARGLHCPGPLLSKLILFFSLMGWGLCFAGDYPNEDFSIIKNKM